MDYQKLKIRVLEIYNNHKDKDRNCSYKHNSIQNDIKDLAKEFGYIGKKEFPCKFSDSRDGKIDIVWWLDGTPAIAFEIDSSARKKSTTKLLSFNGDKVWIYYGDKHDKVKNIINSEDKDGLIRLIQLN